MAFKSEYRGISFMLNIFTSINHMTTTKIVLMKYQKTWCAASKNEYPFTKNAVSIKILKMFTNRSMPKEKIIIFALFFNSIFGRDRLSMRRR